MEIEIKMRSYLCWLLGHDFTYFSRHCWTTEDAEDSKRWITQFVCHHCGKLKTEEEWKL